MAKPDNQTFCAGILKQVLSGDAVVIRGKPKNGPPPERTLYFSNVAAPKLARRIPAKNEYTEDEPFAWKSREFLRNKALGADVLFTVETETSGGRSYGTLYLGKDIKTATNVTKLMLSEGFLKTRLESRTDPELQKLEEEAKTKKVGIFSDSEQDKIRKITWNIEDMSSFLSKNKGKPLTGIIEHIRDGSTLKAFILPDFYHVSIMLSGIRCPAVKYDSEGRVDIKNSEQYSAEAKYFVETRLLQQEVDIYLESVSNNNFLGSVIHPKGNIAEALLKEGFAKCVDWSLANVTGGAEKFRIAEKSAKDKKSRIWASFKPTKSSASKDKIINGRVMEIVNGDAIVIKDDSNELKKVFFSSIRPPRQGQEQDKVKQGPISRPLYEVPWLYEAREYLRKKLIGQTVSAVVDYVQPAQNNFPTKTCCSIFFENENIGENLVKEGFATVLRYRPDDDQRASNYDNLLIAESVAQKEAKGLHAPKKDTPVMRVIDISADVNKAKNFLPFLQRIGSIDAVVEYVASGSRLRVYVPRESCLITFLLSGITCPRGARPAPSGGGMIEGEPFGAEALDFTKSLAMQRDVQIEVESIDRGGNFIGWLHIDGRNVSCLLVENGLSFVHNTAETSKYYSQLTTAELKAKNKSLNLWENASTHKVDEKQVEENISKERNVDVKQMMISEVTRDGKLYGQYSSEGQALIKLMESLRQHINDNPPVPGFKPLKGHVCAAKFSDGNWYRAKVEKIQSGKVHIFYVDYGNREVTTASQLTGLPSRFSTPPFYAHEMSLALVKFSKDEDHLEDGVTGLMGEVIDHLVDVNMEYKINGMNFVTVKKSDTKQDVTKELLKQGLVMVERSRESRDRKFQSLIKEYLEAEDEARKKHLNIFQYGDAREDDAAEFGMER